jgi:hypothetical protein
MMAINIIFIFEWHDLITENKFYKRYLLLQRLLEKIMPALENTRRHNISARRRNILFQLFA